MSAREQVVSLVAAKVTALGVRRSGAKRDWDRAVIEARRIAEECAAEVAVDASTPAGVAPLAEREALSQIRAALAGQLPAEAARRAKAFAAHAAIAALAPRLWERGDKLRVYLRFPRPYQGGAGGGDLGYVDFSRAGDPRIELAAPDDLLEQIRLALGETQS